MFTIIEHKSSSYAPRTYVNAASAQLTVAIASDFNTAGERLTKKAAGDNYLHLDISAPAIENARKLYSVMKKYNITTLNIAGNSIHTLSKCGFTQEDVNYYVYEILALVTNHLKVDKVVSGMQSGIDLAGAVAAKVLGIPFVGTMPNGYKQRWENGVDVNSTEFNILLQMEFWCGKLQEVL